MGSSFFDESQAQSEVKTAIVTKYFWAWAKVIMPWARKGSGKIAYIDLFAGPGRYGDGTTSTPLLVLQRAIEDEDITSGSAIWGRTRCRHSGVLSTSEPDTSMISTAGRLTLTIQSFSVLLGLVGGGYAVDGEQLDHGHFGSPSGRGQPRCPPATVLGNRDDPLLWRK